MECVIGIALAYHDALGPQAAREHKHEQHLPPSHTTHAHATLTMKLQPAIRQFPVLGFWGKSTMAYAGIMAFYRDLPPATSI